jgi:uncharacterized membrane protein YraQ (UPF0718 family)
MDSIELAVKAVCQDFTSIFFEAMPFVVLGVWFAGLLQEYLPQKLVVRYMPRSPALAVALGGLLGLVFPMCECGIIPVMRRLLRKGFPLSCCIAYLLAGPIINVVVILATLVAFSGAEKHVAGQLNNIWMTVLRVGLGYLVAVVTALIVEGQYRIHGNKLLLPLGKSGGNEEDEEAPRAKSTLFQRMARVSETALHDFLDISLFLIFGALLAAVFRQILTDDTIAGMSSAHPMVTILAMMLFAITVTLCSEADAFVAASFATMRPAAKVAFMVLGPMLDMKLIFMYTRIFRPRLIWTIILSVLVQVFVYSYIVHLVLTWINGETPPLPPTAG